MTDEALCRRMLEQAVNDGLVSIKGRWTGNLSGCVKVLEECLKDAFRHNANIADEIEQLKSTVESLRLECGDAAEREYGLVLDIERLKAELKLWRPLTPEEAEQALEEAEAYPMSQEEIDAIVKRVMDPAERPSNTEAAQMAVEIKRLMEEKQDWKSLYERAVSESTDDLLCEIARLRAENAELRRVQIERLRTIVAQLSGDNMTDTPQFERLIVASRALAGLLANPDKIYIENMTYKQIAADAVIAADYLLAELRKPQHVPNTAIVTTVTAAEDAAEAAST